MNWSVNPLRGNQTKPLTGEPCAGDPPARFGGGRGRHQSVLPTPIMPDFKFWERETARRLAKAKDYPDRAREAILEMHRQVGVLKYGPDGLARRGVLIRHLVMPGQSVETEQICRWLAEEVSRDTYINIMGQYRPAYEVGQIARDGAAAKYTEIDRRPGSDEIARAYEAARRVGLWRFDQRGA